MTVNRDAQREMDRDVAEHKELYKAFAATPDDDEDDR